MEEYEKVLEEKRKALLALKAEERKVEVDKELQAMQQLSVKKANEEVFIKLVSCMLGVMSSEHVSVHVYFRSTFIIIRALTRT